MCPVLDTTVPKKGQQQIGMSSKDKDVENYGNKLNIQQLKDLRKTDER